MLSHICESNITYKPKRLGMELTNLQFKLVDGVCFCLSSSHIVSERPNTTVMCAGPVYGEVIPS